MLSKNKIVHEGGTSKGPVVTCYTCDEPGHIASRCYKREAKTEKRVDPCIVKPVIGRLINSGKEYSFCFDTGAECSVITETTALKFPGKREQSLVALVGIGRSNVHSTSQILSQVKINDHVLDILDILFHVIPDEYMSSDILIGRELLSQGFLIEITHNIIFTRQKTVNVCTGDITMKCFDSNIDVIDTDVSLSEKSTLLAILEEFRDSFVQGIPTQKVTTGEFKIRMIDSTRTVQRRPYRVSYEERQIIRKKLRSF